MNKNKVTINLNGQNEQIVKLPEALRSSLIAYLETGAVNFSTEWRQGRDLKELESFIRILKFELNEIELKGNERIYLEWFLCDEKQNDRLEIKRSLSSRKETKLVFC